MYNFWIYSSSASGLYSIAAEPIVLGLKLMFLSFSVTNLILQFKSPNDDGGMISYAALCIEMLCFLLLRLCGPKIKSARMISGILLFIGALTLLFSSFGYGTIIYFIAISSCLFISIGNCSNILGVAFLPIMCPQMYFRLIIGSIKDHNNMDINEIWGNYYITLFIYPAILLLCCQRDGFKLK